MVVIVPEQFSLYSFLSKCLSIVRNFQSPCSNYQIYARQTIERRNRPPNILVNERLNLTADNTPFLSQYHNDLFIKYLEQRPENNLDK